MTPRDVVRLPQPVIARLESRGLAAPTVAYAGGRSGEARGYAPYEVRNTDAAATTITGYASVYESAYDVAGGPSRGGWRETIARGAADKSVRERNDVRLLVNHDGLPLARSSSGTLQLRSDDKGLWSSATLDLGNPFALAVVSALRRGDASEMSFAFRAIHDVWNDDYTERRITEVKLYDVSVVTYPANPATSVALVDEPAPLSLVRFKRIAAELRRGSDSKQGKPLTTARASALADQMRADGRQLERRR